MGLIKGLRAGSVVCSVILLLFVVRVAAAPADKNGASPAKGTPSEAAESKDAGASDADKPDENSKEGDADTSNDEGKPDKASPSGEEAAVAPPGAAREIQSAVKMKDTLAEGFLIRTTVFVPADAVTGQLGKVSPGCRHPYPAKRNRHCGLLLHAQGLCEVEHADIAFCTVFR